jgi:Zn-dependent protease
VRIATISGVPIRLHWSFLALVGGLLAFTGLTSGVGAAASAAVLGVVLFVSVVLHELGHATMARFFGVRTAHITLYPFGGVAAMTSMPREPRQEALIAVAGPAVNGVLAVGFGLAWAVIGGWWLAAFAAMNLLMGVFNLVPAFPMDGGRVFRALLTPLLGWTRASRLAIAVGRGFAALFLVASVALGQLSLALVGGFLFLATWVEARNVDRLAPTEPPRSPRGAWDGRGPYRVRFRLDP